MDGLYRVIPLYWNTDSDFRVNYFALLSSDDVS
jgi:hypothetical protein